MTLSVNDAASAAAGQDLVSATLHFRNECSAKTWTFELVVLRRVVEFAFSKLVERHAHRLDPRSGVSKHVVG